PDLGNAQSQRPFGRAVARGWLASTAIDRLRERQPAAPSLRREFLEGNDRRALDGLEHDRRGHVAYARNLQQAAHGEIRNGLDVAHDHVQQEVHLPGERVAGQYLRPFDQRPAEAFDNFIGVLLELDLHDGLDVGADALRVDDRRISLDESRILELPDAPRARGCRETDPLGEVGDTDAPVGLQHLQDSSIRLVQFHDWRISPHYWYKLEKQRRFCGFTRQ